MILPGMEKEWETTIYSEDIRRTGDFAAYAR